MIGLPRISLLFVLSLASAPSWGESGNSDDGRFGVLDISYRF